MSAVPPPFALREYALLADGERGVLVGPRGEMAWMCFPEWDSPSVFSSLLGGSGSYQVTPVDDHFVWGGYYDESTLIWNSRWVTTDSLIECREALAFPADPGRAVILRRVKAIHGPARLRVRFDLRSDYGRRPMAGLRGHGGVWAGHSGLVWWRWQTGPGVRQLRGGELSLQLDLAQGEQHDLVLELATERFTSAMLPPEELWRATEESWKQTVPGLTQTSARRDATHAFAVLRGMTTSTGAMVAAATTSLPEQAEAGRNYDYRYAWIRDQCFAGQAAAAVDGGEYVLDSSVRFVTERLQADGPGLKPAYRASGDRVPDESRVDPPAWLPGWKGQGGQLGQPAVPAGRPGRQPPAAGRRRTGLDRLELDHWRRPRSRWTPSPTGWHSPTPGSGSWTTKPVTYCDWRAWPVCATGRPRAAGPQAGRWTALADAMTADVAPDLRAPDGTLAARP